MPFLSGYSKRKKFTIDNTYIDSLLEDFAVLLKFTGEAQIGSAAHSTGQNIRTTGSDGTTLLKYARRSFSISGGNAAGSFSVKVPSLSAVADTDGYLYYDNSGASDGQDAANTWTNFDAVLYMDGDPSGSDPQLIDATGNGHSATTTGSMVSGDSVAGQIGNAVHFDDDDDDANFTPWEVNQAAGSLTVWWKPNSNANGGFHRIFSCANGDDGTYEFDLSTYYDANMYAGWIGGGSDSRAKTSCPSGTDWHLLKLTWGSRTHIYIDGADASAGGFGEGAPATWDTSEATHFNFTNGTPFDAIGTTLDEFRISSVTDSAAYAKFEYYNQHEADNEISFGAEETPVSPITGQTSAAAISYGVAVPVILATAIDIGSALASGACSALGSLTGTAAGSASESGGVSAIGALTGVGAAAALPFGAGVPAILGTATVIAGATSTGTVAGLGQIAATESAGAVSSGEGTPVILGQGTAIGAGSGSGTIAATCTLQGLALGSAAGSGVLLALGQLAGQADGSAVCICAPPSIPLDAAGVAIAAAYSSGAITGAALLSADTLGSATGSGELALIGGMAGSTAGSAQASAEAIAMAAATGTALGSVSSLAIALGSAPIGGVAIAAACDAGQAIAKAGIYGAATGVVVAYAVPVPPATRFRITAMDCFVPNQILYVAPSGGRSQRR